MEKANQLNKDGFFNFTFTKALLEEENNDEILEFLEELGENDPSLVIFHGSPRKNLGEFEKFQEKIKNSDKNLYFSSFEDRKFDDLIKEFKEKNISKVRVIPFLIIVGNHVAKDIEGDKKNSYKKVFEENEIEINLVKKSLLLYDKIAEIFVEKLEK
ncbi:sirohydrochlorin cobaltochelatase [Anaerococcus hydrogenalis]|uniref:sirohydrochlorin cobaltochelatase n=1 Tax=Anaerococcus hydrogenalis TaxID=33029 RepID=UPI00290295F9|nr:sirohydrochlorin cobaltochelatase [Anaerococcus hydrogenalis]MDU1316500.1 sirohydrochlorin cobaltochelatase [Anaerococcus hydrogenalis]